MAQKSNIQVTTRWAMVLMEYKNLKYVILITVGFSFGTLRFWQQNRSVFGNIFHEIFVFYVLIAFQSSFFVDIPPNR